MMRDRVLKYCRSDVEILMEGCLEFCDEVVWLTTIDPFMDGITIASVCNFGVSYSIPEERHNWNNS